MKVRMKYKKFYLVVSAFMLAFCMGLTQVSTCFADEGAASTTVSYVKEEGDKYLLSVEVIGNGSVMDGIGTIRDQISKYELEAGTPKTFQVVADEGYVLDKILLNGVDITHRLNDDYLTIFGQDYAQGLQFVFKKVATSGNQSGSGDRVNTGDVTKASMAGITLLLSFAVIILIRKKSKEENE